MRRRARKSRVQGFTLLEALVAIVIISIGLLGLLGLQTVAVINTQTSQFRSFASISAADISARIRSNPAGVRQGEYAQLAPISQPAQLCTGPTPCSPAEIARVDAWSWNTALAQTLPSGRGYVDCIDPQTPSAGNPCRVYQITVAWSERQADNQAASSGTAACNSARHTLTSACFTTEVQP